MGIDEAGKDDSAGAIDFGDLLTMLLDPGIAESIFGRADGDDFAADAEDGGVFENAEFFEIGTAARALVSGMRTQGEKLEDVQQ